MKAQFPDDVIPLETGTPIWERFFQVAPMVLIGTLEPDGRPDLAPKHMVTAMGWDNYFGFVCTPKHATYRNARRSGAFTVTYPRPSQLLSASLAASPRCGEDAKPVLGAIRTLPASRVRGVFMADGYIFLECETHKVVDGFGFNSLVTGKVVAAHAHRDALRVSDGDDQDLIRAAPLFAYLHPRRFTTIADSNAFPMPAGMKK